MLQQEKYVRNKKPDLYENLSISLKDSKWPPKKIHEAQCKHTCTQDVIYVRKCLYASCARVYARVFTKILSVIISLQSLWNCFFATICISKAVLYSKQMVGYFLAYHINTIVLVFFTSWDIKQQIQTIDVDFQKKF